MTFTSRATFGLLLSAAMLALGGCHNDPTETADGQDHPGAQTGIIGRGITTPPPSSLQISGSPPLSVNAGSPYSFSPSVADGVRANLAFQISNKPAWAAFDGSSGKLSGTPAATDVGTSSNVLISVSDGVATAKLAAFSIAVAAQSSSVTVTWTPPAVNSDGTPATNLAGYRVYYGQSEQQMTAVITVSNAAGTDQVVNNLDPGTWYFAVSSFNSANVESKLSDVLPVTI